MAGALSGHIINSYESSVSNQSICTDGLISFAPGMHGAFNPNMHSTQPFLGSVSMGGFSNPLQASTSMCESTYERVNRLQAKLNQKLGPEFISQRPGPGGGPKLTYAEGWKVINVANEVFGFDGWSSNIVSLTTDYMDFNEETRRYNVGVSAVMRVTLKEGVFHEDVGYGMIENAKAKGMALDKCKKEAVTDGLKRTLRTFGNVLGNCLYDKQYTAEIVKIKVPPVKLEKGDLYRLPELSTSASNTSTSASTSTSTSARTSAPTPQQQQHQQQKWQPQPVPQPNTTNAKPISSVPRHMQAQQQQPQQQQQRQQQRLGTGTGTAGVGTGTGTGLQTPITTPAPERKVSFAPPAQPHGVGAPVKAPPPPPPQPVPQAQAHAPDDGDESFFFSDDDAFLASVDMGEGDLGRPIDFEEGAAGALSVVSGDGEVLDEGKGKMSPPPPPQQQAPVPVQDERYGPMGLGGTGTGQAQGQAWQQQQHRAYTGPGGGGGNGSGSGGGNGNASSARMAPPPQPPQRHQQQQQKPVSYSGSGSGAGASNAGSGSGSGSAASHRNQQNQKPASTGARVENVGPAAAGLSGASKRPTTPSVGGFHFPPGMPNPLLQNSSRPPQPPIPQQGVKRNAEAMMGGASSMRTGTSAGMGMGLSLAGGGGGGTRQPLGTLALDGQQQQRQQQYQQDAKRVRR